ncbi:MAG TPA: hypothetical protein VHV77_18710 [Pirellulales bacterium]|jgi:hypothetical protein|nr:hypothetical protein [Pirellulales bacterium]
MRFYWTASTIPELAGLPPDEQKRLWKICNRLTFRHWQVWLVLILVAPWVMGCAVLSDRLFQLAGGGAEGDALRMFVNLLGAAMWIGIFAQTQVAIARPYLRRHRESLNQQKSLTS